MSSSKSYSFQFISMTLLWLFLKALEFTLSLCPALVWKVAQFWGLFSLFSLRLLEQVILQFQLFRHSQSELIRMFKVSGPE